MYHVTVLLQPSLSSFRISIFAPNNLGPHFTDLRSMESQVNLGPVRIELLAMGIVAFAMYYFTYDPWIGKLLYLEDFYVMEEYRGWGIGTELLKNLSQIALESNCSCMHFLVVVWNKPSIEYYMRHGASDLSTEEGWHLFRFDKELSKAGKY
uniref:N-acetyltransferase domain-containing protein n=1 Tax=Pseudonaja textilis TaxID=8673 RepID=A0A670YAQ0_PSETE